MNWRDALVSALELRAWTDCVTDQTRQAFYQCARRASRPLIAEFGFEPKKLGVFRTTVAAAQTFWDNQLFVLRSSRPGT
jgi:hypothetical protein